MRICKLDDCARPLFSKGQCQKHYVQLYRHGEYRVTRHDPRPAIIEGDIAKLPLGVNAKGGYAIIDKEYAHLDQYKWRKNSYGYVVAWAFVDGKKVNLQLQRQICVTPLAVDHINRDPLDNRACNLRPATASQNGMNKVAMANNHSGYKGVCYHKATNKYRAHIGKEKKQWIIGYFNNALDAAKAYNREALKYHGEFARLNDV